MKIFKSLIFIVSLLYSFSIFLNTIHGVFSGMSSFFCYFSRPGGPVGAINDRNIGGLDLLIDGLSYYSPGPGESQKAKSCDIEEAFLDFNVTPGSNPWFYRPVAPFIDFNLKINRGYISGYCICAFNSSPSVSFTKVKINKDGLSNERMTDTFHTNNTLYCNLVQHSEECSVPEKIGSYFYFFYVFLFFSFLILFLITESFEGGGVLKPLIKVVSMILGKSGGYVLCNPITQSFALFKKFDLITVFKGDVDISEEGEGIDFLIRENVCVQFNSNFKLLYLTVRGENIEVIPVKQPDRIKRYLKWISVDPKNCITDSKGHFLTMKECLERINEGEKFGVSVYRSSSKFFCGEAEDNFSYVLFKSLKSTKLHNIKLLFEHNRLFFGSPNFEAFESCLRGRTHFKDRPLSVKNKQWKIYVSDMSRLIGCKCGEVFKGSNALNSSISSFKETESFSDSINKVKNKIVDVITIKKSESSRIEDEGLVIPVCQNNRPNLGNFLDLAKSYKFGSFISEVNKKCVESERSFLGVKVKPKNVVDAVDKLKSLKLDVLNRKEDEEIEGVEEIDCFGKPVLDPKRLSNMVSKLKTEKGEKSLRSDPLLKKCWDDVEKKKKLFQVIKFDWKKIESLNSKSKDLNELRTVKKACVENINRITESTVIPLNNYYDCLSKCKEELTTSVRRIKLKDTLEAIYCLSSKTDQKRINKEANRRAMQSSSDKIRVRRNKGGIKKEMGGNMIKAEAGEREDKLTDKLEGSSKNIFPFKMSFKDSRCFLKRTFTGNSVMGKLSEIISKIARKGIGEFLSSSTHKEYGLSVNAVKSVWTVIKKSQSLDESEYIEIFGKEKHRELSMKWIIEK